jgi:hypothetical protein
VLHVLQSYDRALPFVALGGAIAQLSARSGLVTVALFALGFLVGLYSEQCGLPALSPFVLIVAGTTLVLPALLRNWGVPLLAATLAILIGTRTSCEAPYGADRIPFIGGGLIAGLGLLYTGYYISCGIQGVWLRRGSLIVGSWLVAIGLMLGGLTLAPKPVPQAPAVVVRPPAEIQRVPQID